MKSPLCIYHGNCADGFAGAWIVRRAIPACELHAGTYQNPPPDVRGRDVILVDFSYNRPVLERMAHVAGSLLIIDHHKTALEELCDIPRVQSVTEHTSNSSPDRSKGLELCWHAYFDLTRSGAGLAWDFFFPGVSRPPLLERIEDWDLWRFAYPDTRAILAAVHSYPYVLDTWSRLFETDLAVLRSDGEVIERKQHRDVHELLRLVTRRMLIGGYNVPVANLPYTLASDAGHALAAQNEPFAGCYWDTPEGRVFSLRSTDQGVDVSEIAKQYGGGGHRNASGFRISYDDARLFEVASP